MYRSSFACHWFSSVAGQKSTSSGECIPMSGSKCAEVMWKLWKYDCWWFLWFRTSEQVENRLNVFILVVNLPSAISVSLNVLGHGTIITSFLQHAGHACFRMDIFSSTSRGHVISVSKCKQSIRTSRLFSKCVFAENYIIHDCHNSFNNFLTHFSLILARKCMFPNTCFRPAAKKI